MLEATYQLPKRGELFVRELLSRSPSATFANSTSDLNIGGSSTHSVQVGIQQAISPATTISSQYVVDQTGSALDVYDALGVEEHLKLSKAVSANVQVQGANAVGAGAQGFTLASAALAYAAPSNALRASLGYQMRTGSGGGSTANAGIAGHLSPSLGVMGFIQRAYGNGVDAINDRVSLAYRPLQNDRFVSLAGYTRTNGASLTGGSSGQYSFEELYRPMEQLEIAGRFAYTEDGAGATLAHSALYALRVRRYVGMRNDIGAEIRIIDVPGVATARATEFALEAGHTFGRATRIGVGYNAAGSVDPTMVGQDARRGFYANVTTLLDSIFGWGKNSP
jgi:hypothetical protein